MRFSAEVLFFLAKESRSSLFIRTCPLKIGVAYAELPLSSFRYAPPCFFRESVTYEIKKSSDNFFINTTIVVKYFHLIIHPILLVVFD
jgi:hypothetical protein